YFRLLTLNFFSRSFAAALGFALIVWVPQRPRTVTLLEPPVRDARVRIDGDRAVLVNGRRVAPAGRVVRTQSYSWGLALSPDGSRAALVNRDAMGLVDLREPYTVRRVPPYGTPRGVFGSGSYMGCAFSADGTRFYYGSADEGRILVLDVATTEIVQRIDLNGG